MLSFRTSWEPTSNLSNCKVLLKEFEERLKAIQEKEKDKEKDKGPKRGRPKTTFTVEENAKPIVKVVQKKSPQTPKVISLSPGG